MEIHCKSNVGMIQGSQLVNKLGKYLYKNLDSAYDFKISNRGADVYFTVYYEIPIQIRKTYNVDDDTLYEMNIILNLTTYSNKIRINIIENDEYEKTLTSKTISCEKLQDTQVARKLIMSEVQKALSKEYSDYDFIF